MDLSKIKAKLNELNRTGPSQTNNLADKFWRPEVGKNQIRIVPSAFDPTNPFTELQFHSNMDMFKFPVLTLENLGKDDPIISFIKELRSTSDKENWSLARKLMPRSSYYVPVIVRGEEEKGVRLWRIGVTVFKALLQLAADDEIGDFTDVVSGTDLIIEKIQVEGKQFPEISVRARRNSTELSDDPEKVKLWISAEHQPEPIACFRQPDYDFLKNALERYLTGKPASDSETPEEKKEEVKEASKAPAPVVAKPVEKANVVKKFDDLFDDDSEIPF